MTLLAMSLTAAACGPRTRETDLQRAVKAHDVDAKPGTEESKARKKIESFIGSIIAPGAGDDPDDAAGQQWLEGADVVDHPIGQAAVKLGVPAADLVRGSALRIQGDTAELHVFTPPAAPADPAAPPAPATARHILALDGGTWVFRAGN